MFADLFLHRYCPRLEVGLELGMIKDKNNMNCAIVCRFSDIVRLHDNFGGGCCSEQSDMTNIHTIH